MNWIKCSENMPPYDTRILLLIKRPLFGLNKDHWWISIGQIDTEKGGWQISKADKYDVPIYWTLLPDIQDIIAHHKDDLPNHRF